MTDPILNQQPKLAETARRRVAAYQYEAAAPLDPAHKAAFEIVVGRIEFGLEYAFRDWSVPGRHGRRALKISRQR